MKISPPIETLSVVVRVLCVVLLFAAPTVQSYSYFVLLRWILFAGCLYALYSALNATHPGWVLFFAFVALLFNPIQVVRLDRQTWAIVDSVTATILAASIYFVRSAPTFQAERRTSSLEN